MGTVSNRGDIPKASYIPILWDNAHLGLLVARSYFHTAPIFFRCPSTRSASAATSSMICGSGVA